MKFNENDLTKLRVIFKGYEYDEDFESMIENQEIVKIADDYESAYNDFIKNEEIYGKPNISYDEFLSELKKGYGNSDCVQIARLFELSDGIWYDNEYCG